MILRLLAFPGENSLLTSARERIQGDPFENKNRGPKTRLPGLWKGIFRCSVGDWLGGGDRNWSYDLI